MEDYNLKYLLFQSIFNDLKIINSNGFSMIFNFFLNNSFHIIFWYRISHRISHTKFRFVARIINSLVRIIYSCDISPFAVIGQNVIIMHGFDIVIGANVKIGNNVKIFNGVTLGNRKGHITLDGQPTVGNNCLIGTGAKILGPVTIGDNCSIGANSVVLRDFDSDSVIVGVPAQSV